MSRTQEACGIYANFTPQAGEEPFPPVMKDDAAISKVIADSKQLLRASQHAGEDVAEVLNKTLVAH